MKNTHLFPVGSIIWFTESNNVSFEAEVIANDFNEYYPYVLLVPKMKYSGVLSWTPQKLNWDLEKYLERIAFAKRFQHNVSIGKIDQVKIRLPEARW